MASWAIATTCKDVPEVVLAFVAHHLEAGASEIFLFFDDPLDPSADLVDGLDRVRVFRCDAAHWTDLGTSRPRSHLRRQTMNADHALGLSGAEWIGHIDVDEFLWSAGTFGDVLDRRSADAVRVLPAERIFLSIPPRGGVVFEGGFKLRMPNRRAREIFGPYGPVMFRGFQGHNIGKTFLRTSVPG
ncbi:MAG: glycosyltransferase family 2 protein, partial [Pseudomonadota bacterium]